MPGEVVSGRRVVTADHVLAALAVLGLPASSSYPATEWHMPLLLGVLLKTVETEIADQAGDPDRQRRVVDGYLAQSSPEVDPLSLTVLRLQRTSTELDRIRADMTDQAHLVALETDITDMINRFDALAARLQHLTRAR
jgi:hypothetical protein